MMELLPTTFRHVFESLDGDAEAFDAVIRANCNSAEECHQWMEEFQVNVVHNNSSISVVILQFTYSSSYSNLKSYSLLFNVEKCKVMHVGYNNMCASEFIGNTEIQSTDEEL